MDAASLERAAALIAALRQSGKELDRLPPDCQPHGLGDALAIQDAAIARIGEPVAGWKTAIGKDGAVSRGAVLASRVWQSPARIPAALVPLLGVETEVAFRFLRDLPPRVAPYSRDEVEGAVIAFIAVEIVDSRFRSYRDVPPLDRTADFMSNGGLVIGATCDDWRTRDLGTLEAGLSIDGQGGVQGRTSHPAGHPLAPAVALVNALRAGRGVKGGQFVTTGTYMGLIFVRPGQHVVATLGGFDAVEVTFTT